MEDYKIWFAVIAVFLTFYGYFFYIKSILCGKTRPHIFTWIVWLVTSIIATSIQVIEGAGAGAWPAIVVTGICFAVVILSFKYGTSDIRRMDIIFLLLSLGAIPFWLMTSNAFVAVFLVTGIELVAAFPTIRKSWNRPDQEAAFPYAISALRYLLSMIALSTVSAATLVYPLGMFIKNGVICLIIVMRAKGISSISSDYEMGER